jgi:hypothetical protein
MLDNLSNLVWVLVFVVWGAYKLFFGSGDTEKTESVQEGREPSEVDFSAPDPPRRPPPLLRHSQETTPPSEEAPSRKSRPTRTRLPASTRRAGRFRLGSLSEVRRGVVLMTILGPCRALERQDS